MNKNQTSSYTLSNRRSEAMVYNDKIQMVMDFLKLSFIIDNPQSSYIQKKESLNLQKNLLDIIKNNNLMIQKGGSCDTDAQRLSKISLLLDEIYEKNKQSINN